MCASLTFTHIVLQIQSHAHVLLKPEKPHLCCLSPTRPSKQRQGLNHMGAIFRRPVIWEDGGLCTLPDGLILPFKPASLYGGKSRRSGIQERGQSDKAAVQQFPWHPFIRWPVIFFICVLCPVSWARTVSPRKMTARISPWLLLVSSGAQKSIACDLLASGWAVPAVPEAIAFYMH